MKIFRLNALVIPWLITTSGVSAWSAMSVADGLVAPKPTSQVIGISAGISISGRNSNSGSMFIPRPSRARTSPSYHSGGRSCTRTGHSGRRIGFPWRWDGTQLARQIGATYFTVWIRVHISYRQFHQMIAYLLRKNWAHCRSQNMTFHNYIRQAQKQRDFYVENVGILVWLEKCGIYLFIKVIGNIAIR